MSHKKKDTKKHRDEEKRDFSWYGGVEEGDSVLGLKKDIIRHVVSTLGSDYARKSNYNFYLALAYAVRDRLIDNWIKTQRSYYDDKAKRVYYLSLEYLPGKSLFNNLYCLGIYDTAVQAMNELGYDLDELAEEEWDAGLGNGGLGRLASCFLDSIAALDIPGYGYGIRYDYGMFHQTIANGEQVEKCDNWMRRGNPWEFDRGQFLTSVKFYGHVYEYTDAAGRLRHEWVDAQQVMAIACDMLVPGYHNDRVINMRLWSARTDIEFDLGFFNEGNYIGAVEEKVRDENISKVLYPSEQVEEGRELRLKQQYFFVAATLQDILRRFKKRNKDFSSLPDKVAIQLNDTHPSIAIPELMRLLVDEEFVEWDIAWEICRRTFAYTNHTLLPEALETWPVEMLGRVLPRHLQIIYEINRRFLLEVEDRFPGDEAIKTRLSLIQEWPYRRIRMAHLAIVGSTSVNGVSAMHSELIKKEVFHDFHLLYPTLFNNKTNGITPRRWLKQANPLLAELLDKEIGRQWVCDLDILKALAPKAQDFAFREQWQEMKQANKERLAAYIKRKVGIEVNTSSMFDVHVKRIHEYKRQLLNVLHVITLYNRIRSNPDGNYVPRTVMFGGKAAPGYFMAKLVIRLINGVADVVNNDPVINDRLKVVFLPNYCVSQAERIIPASDLSEQISTAGYEASGTGNMKFALNGALIMGTLDGANIEMLEEVGKENMFIFGHTAEELAELREQGYNPWYYFDSDSELHTCLDQVVGNHFSPNEPGLFQPIFDALLYGGDHYFLLADYAAYIRCQEEASRVFQDPDQWTARSIMNTANMGKFSSDRTIREYAKEIWQVIPRQDWCMSPK